MANHKNKKSYLEEGIPEYDFNKRHKHLQPGAGVEKHTRRIDRQAEQEATPTTPKQKK